MELAAMCANNCDQIGLINSFLEIHPALANGKLCLLSYADASGFLLEENPPKSHRGLPEQNDITFRINGNALTASQAILTNSSLFRYSFRNLLSKPVNLEKEKKFNVAYLKIDLKQDRRHACALSVIANVKIEVHSCQIILSIIKNGGENYLEIKASNVFAFYDMIDIAIRIAQSICFLFTSFNFNKLMLLCSEDCFALTSGAHLNGCPQFSIFTPPSNLLPYLSMEKAEPSSEQIDAHMPNVSRDFVTNFMKQALEEDYFLYLLLFTNESTGVDVYGQTAQMMVALEIFANAEAESDAAKKKEMQELDSSLDTLISEIRNLVERSFRGDTKLKTFIDKKLSGFKSPPNADRLSELCEKLGLELDERDKKTLRLRNDILHGRLNKKTTSLVSSIENYYAAYRLVCELMVRKAGYIGYICKFDRVFPHRSKKLPIGDVFVKI